MPQPHQASRQDENSDLSRVTRELTSRLIARGIAIHDADSSDDIVHMLESVEEFERAVVARGGDLMMDEPPAAGKGQPDDAHFLLPRRADDESAIGYVGRLARATAIVRHHPQLP